jgi:Tc5 transposase DNA-binding domain
VKRNNLIAFSHQKSSPVAEIEPVLVEWCLMLANMGNPLTRETMIKLANEIIDGTVHSHCLSEYKTKRKINNETCVGTQWYQGFINQQIDFLKRSTCKIKDQTWLNWRTYQNFANRTTTCSNQSE